MAKLTVEELTKRIEQLKAKLAKTLENATYKADLGDYHIEVRRWDNELSIEFASHDGDWDRKGWFSLPTQDFKVLITALYVRYCKEL